MYANNFFIAINKNPTNLLTYTFKPEFSSRNKNHDEHVCPLSVQSLYKKSFDHFVTLDPLIPNYITFFNGSQYLIEKLIFNDIYLEKYYNLIKTLDTKNNIIINNDIKIKYKPITLHNFTTLFDIYIYTIFKQINWFDKNDNVLIICKNTAMHRTLSYYKKYTLFMNDKKIDKSIKSLVQTSNTRKQYLDYTLNYYKDKNHIVLPKYLTNEYISKLVTLIDEQYQIIIIDLLLLVKQDYLLVGNNSSFQTLVSCINISLKFLKPGGNLLLVYYSLPNELILNFIVYLSRLFSKFYFANINELVNMKDSEIIIFENYDLNNQAITEMNHLNEVMYNKDPSAGYDYRVSDPEELEEYNLPNEVVPEYKFLTSLITFDDNKAMQKIYKNYKKYITHKFEQRIEVLNNAKKLYVDLESSNLNENKSKIKYLLNINLLKAVDYSKKFNINIVDWVDQDKINEYFQESLLKYYKELPLAQYDILSSNKKNVKIVAIKNINNSNLDNFSTFNILSENAYEITDKVNRDRFKEVELFFNNRQKDLNYFLYKHCKANINGRKVSRAWLKMQELLITTDFFKNIIEHNKNQNRDTIDSLHICEAPGNFINSCNYYVNNHTDMKYNWIAQSLQNSKIYDTYGFIKNNPERWDFYQGGDVTKYENFMYYYKKYQGVDVLISDCGTEWIVDSEDNKFHKELSVYEMFYGLLIPRIGGNFIMKTIAGNYNKQFVTLVYLATIKFEKVYVFKSNNNFWSQEFYLVCISSKGFNEEEIESMFDILKAMENETILYPVENVSDEFCNEYNKIMIQILDQFKVIKKLFTFLIDYEDLFVENNKKLSNLVYQKNAEWLKKFMSHIPDASQVYLRMKGLKR